MRKILVVEDEKSLREVYQIILSSGAFDVTVAENGQRALELCEQEQFELILLDLMMPVLDGVGFLREFSQTENFAKTNVIVMSNLSSGEMLTTAKELGATTNFVKASLSPKELLAAVRSELF